MQVSGFTDKPMPKFSICLSGALLGLGLVIAAVGQSDAKAPLTRSDRCADLSHQVDNAIEIHAAATQVTAAKALQRKGNRYCAARKQAQGIRMLANALKLLGVTPNDPVQ
jgi:predicted lipoprotein